jgi:hypothetical protein
LYQWDQTPQFVKKGYSHLKLAASLKAITPGRSQSSLSTGKLWQRKEKAKRCFGRGNRSLESRNLETGFSSIRGIPPEDGGQFHPAGTSRPGQVNSH